MCKDNQFLCLLVLFAVLFFLYIKGNSSRQLNFDTFFDVDSSNNLL